MGIETAGGQGKLKGELIRVAHYNNWGWPELCIILGAPTVPPIWRAK
jgi:hypothetical protein